MSALPAPVEAVCTTFLSAVPDGLVTGLYLRGGLAFGEWIEGKSDVDFTATLSRRPSDEDVAALRSAHDVVAAAYGESPCFEGSHLLAADLARSPSECPDVPIVTLRELRVRSADDPVAWHELARGGVTFFGPPVESWGIWTDDDVLRGHTIRNLETYWSEQVETFASRAALAASDFACEWLVPGMARLHHLLVTGEQTSKSRALRWGLEFYPGEWHRLLREALHLREGSTEAQYEDPAERGARVVAFGAEVIRRAVPER